MQELSLFSGAGGGLLATKHLLGFNCVGYVEKDGYCQKVLRARIRDGYLDDAPIFDDVRTFDGLAYRGKVDIVTAGFPCQPFSVAGKRKGADDERNCWPDTIRIIREVRPQYAYLENVPGLVPSGYFGTILQDLSESGFNAKWCVLSAAALGAPHRRRRLWILANAEPRTRIESGRAFGQSWESKTKFANDGCKEYVAVAESSGYESSRRESGTESEYPRFTNSSWWAAEPALGRVANGVASRVGKLRALGNGQVPICAAVAFRELAGSTQRVY